MHQRRDVASPLISAAFSRLVLPEMLLVHGGTIGASLGHGYWAGLFYPVDVISNDANGWRTLAFRAPPAGVWWDHVTDPHAWESIPFQAERHPNHGLVLRQNGEAEPLLRACLREPRSLSYSLLQSVAAWLDLPCINAGNAQVARETLLEGIASEVGLCSSCLRLSAQGPGPRYLVFTYCALVPTQGCD